MFFKKGLRDSSLIRKLTMKNPWTFEEILATHFSLVPPRATTRRGRWIAS
jgi:hypothetical protein